MPVYNLIDLVDDLGFRDLAHAQDLLSAFDVETVTLFTRPKSKTKFCIGGTYVTIADAAAFLIELERTGLSIDPALLVSNSTPLTHV